MAKECNSGSKDLSYKKSVLSNYICYDVFYQSNKLSKSDDFFKPLPSDKSSEAKLFISFRVQALNPLKSLREVYIKFSTCCAVNFSAATSDVIDPESWDDSFDTN